MEPAQPTLHGGGGESVFLASGPQRVDCQSVQSHFGPMLLFGSIACAFIWGTDLGLVSPPASPDEGPYPNGSAHGRPAGRPEPPFLTDRGSLNFCSLNLGVSTFPPPEGWEAALRGGAAHGAVGILSPAGSGAVPLLCQSLTGPLWLTAPSGGRAETLGGGKSCWWLLLPPLIDAYGN